MQSAFRVFSKGVRMLKLISPARAQQILSRYDEWIRTVSARYGVPEALIKAILYQEMTQIDIADPIADLTARSGLFGKQDSSTGYAQIFGYVGLNAINFAVDRGIATYESLGVECDHALDPDNKSDVRLVWKMLHDNPKANIEIATLNLIAAADEVVGRVDFGSLTDDELKLVMTRYNSNVRRITSYGEQVFRFYEAFRDGREPTE